MRYGQVNEKQTATPLGEGAWLFFCAQKVMSSQIPGVEGVAVNLEEKAAKGTLSRNVTDEVFKAAVEAAGYQLTQIREIA